MIPDSHSLDHLKKSLENIAENVEVENTTYADREPGQPYTIKRRVNHTGWVQLVNRSNKWTQTDTPSIDSGVNQKEYWKHGTLAHSILQLEINRIIDWYHLSGSRDLNIQRAVSELFNKFRHLPSDLKTKASLKTRISKAITYRKYYTKKKKMAKETGKTIQEVLNRRR